MIGKTFEAQCTLIYHMTSEIQLLKHQLDSFIIARLYRTLIDRDDDFNQSPNYPHKRVIYEIVLSHTYDGHGDAGNRGDEYDNWMEFLKKEGRDYLIWNHIHNPDYRGYRSQWKKVYTYDMAAIKKTESTVTNLVSKFKLEQA